MTVVKEVTLLEFKDNGTKYKVTKKLPEMNISDTKFFDNLEEATIQLIEWT